MKKDVLENLVRNWRAYARDHYCQTYNKGMAQGLEKAAEELEAILELDDLAKMKGKRREKYPLIETGLE